MTHAHDIGTAPAGGLIQEVEQFLYLEARLADESRYAEWEALVEDDMVYWIPRGEGPFDPAVDLSITYDNRTRLANRLKQLRTGHRLAQIPPSPMRRMISNVEVIPSSERELQVFCNFVLYEFAAQATPALAIWPGRTEFRLRRRADGSLAMFFKKAMLVAGSGPVRTIPFIL